jgi:hypothetical protein
MKQNVTVDVLGIGLFGTIGAVYELESVLMVDWADIENYLIYHLYNVFLLPIERRYRNFL